MKKTKIYILTGFLGSGKTTILQKILNYFKQRNESTVVLMNEIGEVNIDKQILPTTTNVKEITGGCLCCQTKEQFENQFISTIQNEKPDNIIIECSGASHPAEVISDCLNPLITDKIDFQGLIAILDTTQFLMLDNLDPAIKQLIIEQWSYSNIIIPTKVDLLSPQELFDWTEQKNNLSFNKKIIENSTISNLMDKLKTTEIKNATKHHHHIHLQTITYTFQNPISSIDFENWLLNLPKTVIRLKGFLNFKDKPTPKCYLFQYAYGVPFYQEYELKIPYNFVIIGQDLDHDKLLMELEQLDTL